MRRAHEMLRTCGGGDSAAKHGPAGDILDIIPEAIEMSPASRLRRTVMSPVR